MAQAGLELTTSCLLEWSLSEFCHTDSCFPSVETRIYKNRLLFIYGPRSLLSCCTVLARHHGQSVARFCPWNTKQDLDMKTLKKYKNIFKLKQPCSLLPKPMALVALAATSAATQRDIMGNLLLASAHGILKQGLDMKNLE